MPGNRRSAFSHDRGPRPRASVSPLARWDPRAQLRGHGVEAVVPWRPFPSPAVPFRRPFISGARRGFPTPLIAGWV